MKALITGASKGIGYAIAHRLAAEKIDLIIVSRNSIELESVKSEILEKHPGTDIRCHAADLSQKSEVRRLSEIVLGENEPLGILVNNAGGFVQGGIIDAEEGMMERMMDINFYSAYHLTRAVLPLLRKEGPAYVFNISSIAGLQAYKSGHLYCISKFAMRGFSLCLREELKEDNIKVCTLYPGATWTDSWKSSGLPEERFMQAADIAEMIATQLRLSPSAVMEEITMRPQPGDI